MVSPRVNLSLSLVIFVHLLSLVISNPNNNNNNNFPPRFITKANSGSEIVVRVKEGPSSLGKEICRLSGEDPDGDQLSFGVLGPVGQDILRIENRPPNEAIVYLRKELDRETRDSYTLVLSLTDGKLGKGNSITKSMLIIVEDVNDNEPVFRPFRTTVSLSEKAQPGWVETVEAFDQDEGRFGQVLYRLQEVDNESGPKTFDIQTVEGRGVISLVSNLDYERQSLYQLKILAIDRAMEGDRKTATGTLLVRVEDAEDQPPVFTFVPSVTRIPENLPIGSSVFHVIAVDGDHGVNNPVSYSITKGPKNLFVVNSSSGVVSVNHQLDRESLLLESNSGNAAYVLEIQATEVTAEVFPPPSVSTEVTIILNDVNDEVPRFKSAQYNAEISENAQLDMPIKFLDTNSFPPQVYDFDQGNNGTFSLHLEGEYARYFDVLPAVGINEASFMVRVKEPGALDYEAIKSISLRLVAKERVSTNPQSSSAQIMIRIKDVNDNFPEFERETYKASVAENALKGTHVVKISAHDVDSGLFGTAGIRYTDLQGSIASKLNLNPVTGVITVKDSNHGFDRETVSQYYLTVEARDNNGTGNRNTVQLLLTIEDVNDNRPKFLVDQYEARIYENDVHFQSEAVVKAIDADKTDTPNSQIRYSIVNGQFKDNFTIDSKSGQLKVKHPLDFEKIPSGIQETKRINLTVRATDLGSPPLSSEAQVSVIVYDKNDHTPQFLQHFYSKSIPEDIRDGSMVLQVKAVDADQSPTNSRVFYRIASGALDKFVIDANTGLISVSNGASLDPDRTNPKQTFYVIRVIALDGNFGDDQRHSHAIVNISIVDVNNKVPEFLDPGPVTVMEDAPIGFFVTRVSATDLDSRPLLRYSIDYDQSEARNEYGTQVDIMYFKDAFSINPVDGTIRVGKPLDRESWDIIKLHLIVEDIAAVTVGQKASATLTIKIDDVNDNRPVFGRKTYSGTIMENAASGTSILTVAAEDKDLNKTLKYSLEGRIELLSLVDVDQRTGEVRVNGKIDREIYNWINLTVRAMDTGNSPLSGLALIEIRVLDENDNNPVFKTENHKVFYISEDGPVGSLVAQIEATDDDTGDYGKIAYLLDSSSSQGKFKIDRETGAIIIADKLDREEVEVYNLLIQAVDNYEYGYISGESRKAFMQITVKVTDVNDETPVIKVPVECASITEYHGLRETVTIVSATDKDDYKTNNAKVRFSIMDGNQDNLFDIEPVASAFSSATIAPHFSNSVNSLHEAAAKIVSRFSLRTRVGNYTLTIKAEDEGSPARQSIARIPICVTDVNDRSPVFEFPPSNYTVRIPENATIGTPVIEVRARDDDSGMNAVVNYRLRELSNGHWKSFSINKASGLITLRKQLDREKQKIHELRVEAYDLGEPTSLSTDLDLTVLVTNVDDYEPEFTQDSFEVTFTENLGPNQEKFKLLSTVDKDEIDYPGDNGSKSIPCYYIVGGDFKERFKLDIFTHYLTTTVGLDREERSNYTLIIQATNDCLREPKPISKFDSKDNSLLQVFIAVKDINDNPPKFTKRVFTGGVTTEAEFGTIFMRIKAIDLDYGPNSVVHYYIIGPQKNRLSEGLDLIKEDPFVVNRKSGEISLNFDPQKNMKGYFEFQVQANDTGGLSDSAKVKIYLLREDQRVRFVLRLSPFELREKLDKFRDVLGNITGAIVNVDSYKFHANQDGSVDKKKTDLFLHFVNPADNSIMEVNNVLVLIDKNIEYLDELYKEFNVLLSEPAESNIQILTFDDQLKACLIGTTSFLILLLILITCLCISQKNRYERKLKAATVTAFGPRDPQLNRADVPNTNIHADEGSNPIWMTGYDNEWFKDDEQISHNSNGNNSLDENAVAEITHGPLTPTDSLNGSGRVSGSDSSTNDRKALCRGVSAGRLTPQNISLPSPKNKCGGKKTAAPQPPHINHKSPSIGTSNNSHIACKNSINTVYVSSYSDQSQYHPGHLGNNLSIMNLETTEL